MFRFTLFFLYLLFDVIAHPFASNFDDSGLSWLPDETSSFLASPDNSGDTDLYAFDLSSYNSQNDWEVSCEPNLVVFTPFLSLIPANSAQQDSYPWEPLGGDESVSSVPISAIEETDSSNNEYFEQSQLEEPDLSSMTPYTGDICARDGSTSVNGAMCHLEPQCANGRLPMCCSQMTLYGRPTDCTRCLCTLINNPQEKK